MKQREKSCILRREGRWKQEDRFQVENKFRQEWERVTRSERRRRISPSETEELQANMLAELIMPGHLIIRGKKNCWLPGEANEIEIE